MVDVANQLFDKVKINWRHDASIFELIRNIGKDYPMICLGAPLAKSEVSSFYQRIKQDYPGKAKM